MTPEEAGEVIATLQACFPQSKLPESTVISWIRLLSADGERFDADDAFAAIDMLAMSNRWMPSMREMTDAMLAAKRDRFETQPRLAEASSASTQTFAEFLEQNPKWKAQFGGAVYSRRDEDKPHLIRKDIDWQKQREEARELDKPTSGHRHKPCDEHEYLVHDRCHWCGAPMKENA